MLKSLADFAPTWPVWLALVGTIVFGITYIILLCKRTKWETEEKEEERRNRESQFRQEITEREERWHKQQLEILAMVFDKLGVGHAEETAETKTNKQDKTSQT